MAGTVNSEQARFDLTNTRDREASLSTRAHFYLVGLAFSVLGLALNSTAPSCRLQESADLRLVCLWSGGIEIVALLALLAGGLCGILALRAGLGRETANFEIARANWNITQLGSRPPSAIEMPDGERLTGREYVERFEEERDRSVQRGMASSKRYECLVGGLLWLTIAGLTLLAVSRGLPRVYELCRVSDDGREVGTTIDPAASPPGERPAEPSAAGDSDTTPNGKDSAPLSPS